MSKHLKMVSKSGEEEEDEEWLDDSHHRNGRSGIVLGFKKGGRGSMLTRLEKIFLALLFLLVIALIASIIALVVKQDKDGGSSGVTDDKTKEELETCISTDCVTAAANMNAKIDYSIHPCDDFYRFACGKWMSGRVIPEDRSSLTIFTELRSDVDIILKNLLEAPIKESEQAYIKKSKTLYASCLNYDHINSRGVQPLVDLVNKELGGWPLANAAWTETSFDLTNTMTALHRHSCYTMIAFYQSVNLKNSTKRILQIDQTSFGMPSPKYYLVPRNDTMLMAYQSMIYKIGKIFGFANPTTAEQEVKDIVDFEIKLAKIAVPVEERRDANALYNPMTLEEVSQNYSEILDWKRFVKTIMETSDIGINDITDQEMIINLSPPYYTSLIGVLKATPKRTLSNYLVWRQIWDLLFTQGDVTQEISREYKKVVFGTSSNPPRYRTCVNYVSTNNPLSVGKMFIKDHFDDESKTAALGMIKDLHHSFEEILGTLDWMDDKTKEVAREKNKFIDPKIGYPEDLTNETYMVQLYENYTYYDDQYMENVVTNLRESFKGMMKKLRDPIDKSKTSFSPSNVNAFYSPSKNQIMFPAGILQPPFFSKTFPNSLNYGGIGMVIGHEITHGFDDKGRQYDKDGNLVQWWSQSAEDKFKVKSQCIVDQYSNYTLDSINMNLNGINTQGENIADNGGLKQSFKAYRNWVSRQGHEEKSLPGLNFSHNQLFFINFAQIWCSLMRDEDAINRVRSAVHSPERFRVIGTTQNSEDFSRVWNCPASSKMNPKKKCTIW